MFTPIFNPALRQGTQANAGAKAWTAAGRAESHSARMTTTDLIARTLGRIYYQQ